jgi:phenylacetate-coenzyme A ligase PaaK-like adenylate-forming protein
MLAEQKYWNPVLETLPQEKIRQLQLKKFKRIFEWTYERSRFHRGLYDARHSAERSVSLWGCPVCSP